VGQAGLVWDNVITSFIYADFDLFFEMMKKIFAIIGALIAGGLGISLIPQAAHAGVTMN
jgi:hypothetical protein